MNDASDLAWHPLGELLVQRGLVRSEDVQLALEIQEQTGQLFGEILLSRNLLMPSDIALALGDQHEIRIRQMRRESARGLETPPDPRRPRADADPSYRPLGQILLECDLITADGLVRALREQKRSGKLLGEVLVGRGWLTVEDIERALAEQRGITHEATHHARPAYEVREADSASPLARCSNFLDATDVTFDVLDSRDPQELVIVKIDGDSEEVVWVYRREVAGEVA